jgi:hypothetical protein
MRAIRWQIDRVISRLDELAGHRKASERLLFMIVAAVLPLFMAFEFLVPAAQAYQHQSRQELSRMQQQLQNYSETGASEDAAHLQAQIDTLKAQTREQQALESYIRTQLMGLNHLYFTRQEWSAHLDWLATRAKADRVGLSRLENRVAQSEAGFVPVMAVEMKGRGAFESVMRYLHHLESGEKLSVIDYLALEGAQQLDFEASLALWGVH